MAHIPLHLQTTLGGRSIETVCIGAAPGFKSGILLYNPISKSSFVRRSFKAIGTERPLSTLYRIPIDYETSDFPIPTRLQSEPQTEDFLDINSSNEMPNEWEEENDFDSLVDSSIFDNRNFSDYF
jgi:hypothetical protein